jgi:hypothetical protein
MDRDSVYKLIDGERRYQADQASKWNHKDVPTIEAELLMMEKYLHDARTKWVTSSVDQDCLHEIRKVIAMGVRCLENHGNYSHNREGY